MTQSSKLAEASNARWLRSYYATRAVFSFIWVTMAWSVGTSMTPFGSLLLVAYPFWDAIANVWDARRNGGWRVNLSQIFNALVSTIVAIAVAIACLSQTHGAFYAFGAWAFLAGVLQLMTAVRRWRGFSAQWPMVLSGAQSAAAGIHFVIEATHGMTASAKDIAPYAAFGAFYFAISAIALTIAFARQRHAVVAS